MKNPSAIFLPVIIIFALLSSPAVLACDNSEAANCLEVGYARHSLTHHGKLGFTDGGWPSPGLHGLTMRFTSTDDNGDFFLLQTEFLKGNTGRNEYHSDARKLFVNASHFWHWGNPEFSWYGEIGGGYFRYENNQRFSGNTSAISEAEGQDFFMIYGGGFDWKFHRDLRFSAFLKQNGGILLDTWIGTRIEFALRYSAYDGGQISLSYANDDWSKGVSLSYTHRF